MDKPSNNAPKKKGGGHKNFKGKSKAIAELKYTRKIDDMLNEELFKLWIGGCTLKEIYMMYTTSPRSFEYESLLRAKASYEWEERRAKIVAQTQKEFEDTLKVGRRKQLKALQMIMDMNLHVIEKAFVKFMEDPEAYMAQSLYPAWIMRNMGDLVSLAKVHTSLSNPESVLPKEEEQNELYKALGIAQVQHTKVFSLLRELANERNLKPAVKQTDIVINGNSERDSTS